MPGKGVLMMSAAENGAVSDEVSGDAAEEVGGTTEIADSVVAKIAGVAARRVAGVHSLGSGAAKALGSLRDAIGQTDDAQGIKVSLDGTETSVQVVLTAEYAYPLHEVASAVRNAVYVALRDWAGLKVSDVNVQITDVFAGAEDSSGGPGQDTSSSPDR
uniref:Asp23/Gls24 family envelope stress response protein n=1 Tax=Pseudarthrobacter oxydans TaxID=1671 RepID=UPI003F495DF6